MPLITKTDLEHAFGAAEIAQLADRNADGQADVDPVGEAIAFADGLVMGTLGGAGLLPLPEPLPAPAAAVLKGYAGDLARERLYGSSIPDEVKRRGDLARSWLKLLGSNGTTLPGVSPEPAAPMGTGSAAFVAPGRVFTPDSLAGF